MPAGGKPIDQGLIASIASGIRRVFRGREETADYFSPGQPLNPIAPEGTGGRQFDYDFYSNTVTKPRAQELTTFQQLRALADGYDLMRLVIEGCKDAICATEFGFQAKNGADPRIAELEAFFKFPDAEHDWQTWLRMVLEDMLVLDAACLYPVKNLAGKVLEIRPVDGSTIKRIIDNMGWTPIAPAVAYQQYLKGTPAADFTADELVYAPRNVRVNKFYGFSPVEQVIMTVNIALRRQLHQLQFYTEGNVPESLIGVPETWDVDQIKKFQLYWDSLFDGSGQGNTALRRRAKFVPGGMKYQPTKEGVLKDPYDEWLARILCYAFSVSPTALVAQVNRATAESAKDQAEEEGQGPRLAWVKSLIDRIILKHFKYTGIEFVWKSSKENDPLIEAQIRDIYIKNGVLSVDEVREEMGLKPLGMANAVYGLPPIMIADVLNPPEPPTAPAVAQLPAPAAGDNPSPAETAKLAKKKALRRIDRNRKSVKTARKTFAGQLASFLAKQPALIAAQIKLDKLAKAADDAGINALLDSLDLDWSAIIALSASAIATAAKDGGAQALLQISVSDEGITNQVNRRAVEFAQSRGAELVGMRKVGGEFVTNPDARFAITDSTRESLRSHVTQAIEEGWSNDRLQTALEDSYAFSADRAETIARTETAKADVQGNLIAYKESGVVEGKQSILGSEHGEDDYDECNVNAEEGVIPLDQSFSSGDDGPPYHPGCICDCIPVVNDPDDSDSQTDTTDEA